MKTSIYFILRIIFQALAQTTIFYNWHMEVIYMPNYEINGSKIKVIRKSEETGRTILDGIISSIIIYINSERKSGGKSDNKKSKPN